MNIYHGIIIFCALLGSFGQYGLKRGSDVIDGLQISTIILNKWLWIGLFLYGCAMVGYIIALNRGDLELSQAYPLISLSYLATLLISFWLLHEKVSTLNIAGSILLLVSIWMMVK